MDVRWVAVAATLTIGGIGVLMKVFDESLKNKKVWGTLGTLLILTGLTIGVGTILSSFHSGTEVADSKETPSEGGNQTMTDSPGGVQVQGDNNIINQGLQGRRITKEDEFKEALRAVSPVTIGLEFYEDRDASFLYTQLYHLLIASGWTADERAQVSGSPWVGIHVVVKDKDNVPPGAIELVKQLRANSIASILVPGQNLAAFEKVAFIVRVGYRPPNNNK